MAFSIENKVGAWVVEKIADREDLFLVGVKMHPNGKLEVLIDGDTGVSIEDCVAVSRYVGFQLEEQDVISHAYRLEVSSPGIDAPLTSVRQYRKNIGRTVQVRLQDGIIKEGKLLEVMDEHLTITEKIKVKGMKAVENQSNIPFENITTIKVLISFK